MEQNFSSARWRHYNPEVAAVTRRGFLQTVALAGLTRKSGSITGAVAFHGMSNAFSSLLFAGYHG